jgi:hypothetical protein
MSTLQNHWTLQYCTLLGVHCTVCQRYKITGPYCTQLEVHVNLTKSLDPIVHSLKYSMSTLQNHWNLLYVQCTVHCDKGRGSLQTEDTGQTFS